MSIIEQLFIDTLRRTQWLTAEQLARYQRPLLERLLRHAAAEAPFYRDRLRPVLSGNELGSAPVDFSHWADVPVVTRAEAFQNSEAMKALHVPPETGDIVSGQSSGSTGEPLKHVRSKFADTAANCQLDRVYELFDFDLFGTLAWLNFDSEELFPYPHGRKLQRWNRTAPDADLYLLDIKSAPHEQLEWLRRIKPDYLNSYPNNLRAVADLIGPVDHSGLAIKGVIATGEILTPEARDVISRAFGCRVVDVYGAREIGQVAFECPQSGRYHFCAELVIGEIVDDQGRPVRPGELGRVVVTPLYNYAMPFIRYDLGDYAISGMSPCPCGRGLPSFDRIIGRIRNLFVMPDGSRKWPATTSEMASLFPYRQFQMIQTDSMTLEFHYVPVDPANSPDPTGLIAYLRRIFHSRLEVRVKAVDRIERSAGAKFEMFISRVRS